MVELNDSDRSLEVLVLADFLSDLHTVVSQFGAQVDRDYNPFTPLPADLDYFGEDAGHICHHWFQNRARSNRQGHIPRIYYEYLDERLEDPQMPNCRVQLLGSIQYRGTWRSGDRCVQIGF